MPDAASTPASAGINGGANEVVKELIARRL
jgi:hypothetical protein